MRSFKGVYDKLKLDVLPEDCIPFIVKISILSPENLHLGGRVTVCLIIITSVLFWEIEDIGLNKKILLSMFGGEWTEILTKLSTGAHEEKDCY